MKKWYAVQKSTEDAWDYGSSNHREAVKMAKATAKEYGEAIIATIENDVCIAEEHIERRS